MRIVLTIPAGRDPSWTVEAARHALEAAVAINRAIMSSQDVPLLYDSQIRFQREPDGLVKQGIEQFDNVLTVLARGHGDCDDLVAWRVAELRERDEPATVRVVWPKGTRRFHAQVRRADGSYEDPSRILTLRALRKRA